MQGYFTHQNQNTTVNDATDFFRQKILKSERYKDILLIKIKDKYNLINPFS